MEAYCLKCKQTREIENPRAEYTVRGAPITKGQCAFCHGNISKMGVTPEHANVDKERFIVKTAEKPVQKRKTVSGKQTAKKNKTAKRSAVSAEKKAKAGNNGKIELVIVESPAKAKTVGRFLGKKYLVKASKGHVRDLKRSGLSVDVEHDFEPAYRVPNEQRALIKELSQNVRNAKKVYLATDPDREGEAIAWHLMESTGMDPEKTERVVFHEITEPAIKEAFDNPRGLNMDLVDAQQARRILDRLVGYNLSPLLWNKVQRRLSAGRVQSVAAKMVVDREREIEAFVPIEYWTVTVELKPEDNEQSYQSRLIKIGRDAVVLNREEEVNRHLDNIRKAAYLIESIKSGTKRRKPSAPFTTSTLQQEASKTLGYTTKKTMIIAQDLYEGIDLGSEGLTGLITYMRTDSTFISQIAQQEARSLIQEKYGKNFVPDQPPVYKTRALRAQEAHEAIRPTDVNRTPEKLKSVLTRDQMKLYQLIWKRFVASQMESALFETLTVGVLGKKELDYHFRSTGSKLVFPGFLAVYGQDSTETESSENAQNVVFPDGLKEGQRQIWLNTIPEQHFTQPPARYTEATLVKALEEKGIGRPSTYSATISTILDRGYVVRDQKKLYPTEMGFLVNDLLVKAFPGIVNEGFTSELEDELDDIADGGKNWRKVVGDFYSDFEPALKAAQEELPKTKIEPEKVNRACPECGNELVYRNGRNGRFIGCSTYPKCRYTETIRETIDVPCPKCGKEILVRHSKRGRTFYGCSGYPDCDFVSWSKPVAQKCPNCGGLLVQLNHDTLQCTECKQKIETVLERN